MVPRTYSLCKCLLALHLAYLLYHEAPLLQMKMSINDK